MPHRKELKQSIKFLILAILGLLLAGTVIFSALEGWSLIDSFYFVTMTATTVGYGDFTPTHALSKIITIIYSLAIIPFILYAFSVIAKFQVEGVYRKVHGLERKQEEQKEDIEKTERKLTANRNILKEQKKELEGHQRKIRKQAKINRTQDKEIEQHDAELEIVEEVVEKALTKKRHN